MGVRGSLAGMEPDLHFLPRFTFLYSYIGEGTETAFAVLSKTDTS